MRLLLLWGWIIIPGYEALVGPKEVSGPEGSSLSVQCSYEDKHQEKRKYWCKVKGIIFSHCDTFIITEAGKEETVGKVSIKDNPENGTFTVIIREVTLKDAGKYLCGISLIGFDEVFAVTVVVFSGLRSSVSPNPSPQPFSTRSVQQGAKVWKTQSPELRLGSSVSSDLALQPLSTKSVQQGAKVYPRVNTGAEILRRGQETLQTRTQQDAGQAVTSYHSSSDMNPRSRPSIPLIRILAPCIILLLLLVVTVATVLILLARRKKAQLVEETGKNGQLHDSNSLMDGIGDREGCTSLK